MSDLLQIFQDNFEIIPAITSELKEQSFKLRYEVICHDLKMTGYEAWKYPNRMEMDEYDARSCHCILLHRPSLQIIGTVRLILSNAYKVEEQFPIEKVAKEYFYYQPNAPKQCTAEISRFIISRPFRSGKIDLISNNELSREQKIFPYPVLGLLAGIANLSKKHNIENWYTVMEPSLNRLLSRLGLQFDPIGPVIDYYGRRQPHFANVPMLIERVYNKRHDIGEFMMYYWEKK